MPAPAATIITYCPPSYPAALRPFTCRHDPRDVMQAKTTSVRRGRRTVTEIDHRVCFACGRSLDASYGGNVLVDLQMLWLDLGWHRQIGQRIIALRDRWVRIAARLFGPDGWNGRHERLARLIDPNLTMKLEIHPTSGASRVGRISFDPSYLRPADPAEVA